MVRDLFDDRNSGYLTDQALLVQLATAKLEEAAKAYEGKGWKWIELSLDDHHWNFHALQSVVRLSSKDQKRADKWQARLEELCNSDEVDDQQQAEIDKIESQLRDLEQANQTWTDEAKAMGGVYLTIGRDGKVQVHEGLQTGEDRKGEERKLKLVAAQTAVDGAPHAGFDAKCVPRPSGGHALCTHENFGDVAVAAAFQPAIQSQQIVAEFAVGAGHGRSPMALRCRQL